jgi:hypothetical protein
MGGFALKHEISMLAYCADMKSDKLPSYDMWSAQEKFSDAINCNSKRKRQY